MTMGKTEGHSGILYRNHPETPRRRKGRTRAEDAPRWRAACQYREEETRTGAIRPGGGAAYERGWEVKGVAHYDAAELVKL
jgi:hypothetical protein